MEIPPNKTEFLRVYLVRKAEFVTIPRLERYDCRKYKRVRAPVLTDEADVDSVIACAIQQHALRRKRGSHLRGRFCCPAGLDGLQ